MNEDDEKGTNTVSYQYYDEERQRTMAEEVHPSNLLKEFQDNENGYRLSVKLYKSSLYTLDYKDSFTQVSFSGYDYSPKMLEDDYIISTPSQRGIVLLGDDVKTRVAHSVSSGYIPKVPEPNHSPDSLCSIS